MSDDTNKDKPSLKVKVPKPELTAEEITKREVLTERFYDLKPNEVMMISNPLVDVKARKTERDGHMYLDVISLHKEPYTLMLSRVIHSGSNVVTSHRQSILKNDFIHKTELLVDDIDNIEFGLYYGTSSKCVIPGYDVLKSGSAIAKIEIQIASMKVVDKHISIEQKARNNTSFSGRE